MGEDVVVAGPLGEPLGEVAGDVVHVAADRAPRVVAGDDELGEVLVEDVAHDPDREVGLAVQQTRRVARGRLVLDALPLLGEALDVGLQLGLRGALGGSAHDDAGVVGNDLLEDLLQPGALGVGQLAADAGHRTVRHVHEVAARQRHLRGEPGALVPDRILGDLHEHRLPAAQRVLDAAGLVLLQPGGVPVDLTGVEHGVAALADVDERRLHARQHVLHPAEVDVAGHRRGAGVGDRPRP